MLASGGGTRKQVSHVHGGHNAGFLARPRLGTVRGVYSTRPLSTRSGYLLGSGAGASRKMKYRKTGTGSSKMDSYKKRPDPVDTAYREAVGRLKVLLAESYTIPIVGKRTLRDDSGDDTDNQSLMSSRSRHSHHHYLRTSPFISRRYPYYSTSHTVPSKYEKNHVHTDYKSAPETERKDVSPEKWEEKQQAPEMMSFIHRQEDYIEQLEREAQFCRDELSGLLGKVKEVISENENLHEKQKSNLIKSVFDHLETETETEAELELSKSPRKSPKKSRRLEGPSIVFESRISELEAQLTQTKIELRKCQEENENYKRKIADGTIGDLSNFDSYKMQIDNLHREKGTLQDQITKLQYELAQLKERNNDTSHKIKRSLDVVEQAQFEKTQLESEIRRLKDELDRQHDKLRETIHEQGRRIADERTAVERRYTQQIEQLTAELGIQWETTSKLQLELDKQRREDTDVRREVAQKQAHIDELRKEMQTKTGVRFTAALQSDLAASGAERGALEQQVAALNLAVERAERQGKAEAGRLQAEVQSLRQRLDRADSDLLHSRRENLRLAEQVASLEKEMNMNALLTEDKKQRPSSSAGGSTEPASMPALPLPAPKDREKELSSMIKDMEAKHVATVAELEGMIQSQNQLMEKLTSECHLLTQKLEDSSTRHKEEIRELQTNLGYLSNKFKQQHANVVQSSIQDEQHPVDNNERPAPPQHSTTPTRSRVNHPSAERPPVMKHNVPESPLTSPQKTSSSPQPQASSPLPSQPSSPTTAAAAEPSVVTTPKHKQPSPEPYQEELQQPVTQEEYTPQPQQQPESEQYYPEQQPDATYDQQYPQDQTYDEQQYPQQQYDEQKHEDYPMDQQYVAEDQYQDQQYPTEQQYPPDQQYPADQQYLAEQQQYAEDPQYMAGQQYDENQQYVMDQQQYPQDYPMEQDYPTEEQYPADQQQHDSNLGGKQTAESHQQQEQQQPVSKQPQQPIKQQAQPETK